MSKRRGNWGGHLVTVRDGVERRLTRGAEEASGQVGGSPKEGKKEPRPRTTDEELLSKLKGRNPQVREYVPPKGLGARGGRR